MRTSTRTTINRARGARHAELGLFAALVAAAMLLALPCAAWAAGGDLAAGNFDNAGSAANAAVANTGQKDKAAALGITTQSFGDLFVATPADCDELVENEPMDVSLDEDNDYVQWFSFVPSESGVYVFESSDADNDPYGALYGAFDADDDDDYDADEYDGCDLKRLAYDDDDAGYSCFRIVSPVLEAGETYYLACSDFNYGYEDCYTVIATAYDPYDLAGALVACDEQIMQGTTASAETLNLAAYVEVMNEDGDFVRQTLTLDADYQIAGWYKTTYDEDDGEAIYTPLREAPSTIGSYVVRLQGIGDYHGQYDAEFRIVDPYNLGDGCWQAIADDVYSDATVTLKSLNFTLYCDIAGAPVPELGKGYELVGWYEEVYDSEEDDWVFEPLSAAPKTEGDYAVEIKGIGDYTGTRIATFHIYDRYDIENYGIYCNDTLWANGNAVTASRLGLVVFQKNNTASRLVYGTHYKVAGWYQGGYDEDEDDWVYTTKLSSAPKAAGEYMVVLKGVSPYSGTTSATFTIQDPLDLSNYGTSCNHNIAYTGSAVTLAKLGLSVYRYNESGATVELTYGTDYTISRIVYEDPDEDNWSVLSDLSSAVEQGYYYVMLTSKGSYYGDAYTWFYVVDSKSLATATVSGVKEAYSVGDAIPTATVTALDGVKLKNGTHYTQTVCRWTGGYYAYEEVSSLSEAGEYFLHLVANEATGYTGELNYYFYVYDPANATAISDEYYIDGLAASYACTGKALKPAITVRSKKYYPEVLYEGQDYIVSYKNNVFSGTATVTVKGMNNYKGTLTKTFKITLPKVGVRLPSGKSFFTIVKKGKMVAYSGTTASGKVKIPAKVKLGNVTYKVTAIAAKAFKGNKKVKAVTIGANVAKVGKNAFKGASKVKTVTIATNKLNKASIKNILKGSKVKTLKLTGKAKAKKALYKSYAGSKVTVK